MQITHEEARRLIHFKADSHLNASNEENLSAHLGSCKECQRYFETLKETESTLKQTMRKRWNLRPLPLHMDVLYAKAHSNSSASIFLTTRTTIIGIAFVMFAFITWQSMSSNRAAIQAPLGTMPIMIPTPATQHTSTNTLESDCVEVRYAIQPGDTLEGIASQFAVSKETIITANHLTGERLDQARELVIPICGSTPTSTTHPPALTITPRFDVISTTPG
jgi:predicted anti-sigma-YlaC factor YlaD